MEFNGSGQLSSDFSTLGDLPYATVLRNVQAGVAGSLNGQVEDMKEENLKDIILRYIREHGITCSLTDSATELTNYIYHDMAGLSFITRDPLFDRDGFEELNIDAWVDIKIMENGVLRRTNYRFLSPQHALDMLTVFGAVVELEREYILQRQREGIAIAKQHGKYKGRKQIESPDFDRVVTRWRQGEVTAVRAMELLGMSIVTFYRRVKEITIKSS